MHANRLLKITTFFVLLLLLLPVGADFSNAQLAPEEYKKSIEQKSKELEEINAKIKETHSNLEFIGNTKRTLNNDLKRLDVTLRQVDLGIQASEINLEKIQLELDSLSEQRERVKEDIEMKRQAVMEGIRAMNKADRVGFLQVLLRSESLVGGSFEVQALQDIHDVLSLNIGELEGLKDQLSEALDQMEAKKNQLEKEKRVLGARRDLAEDQKKERRVLLAQTSSKEQVYQQQLTELEQRQEDIAKEVERLEMELRGQIDVTKLPFALPGLLQHPVPGGRLTQGYGKTTFASANRQYYRTGYHNGIDIGKFAGAEILSAEDGIVVAVGNQGKYYYGRFIVVKHFNGLTTLYAHLSRQLVSVGEEVKRGQVIGLMGSTGYSTGPHLHFTVYDTSTYRYESCCGGLMMPRGGDIDPMKYL